MMNPFKTDRTHVAELPVRTGRRPAPVWAMQRDSVWPLLHRMPMRRTLSNVDMGVPA